MGIQVPGFGVSEHSAGLDLNGYSEWQHPHTSGRIYMSPEVVQAVSSRSLRALRATPASEVGGLLWGRILTNGSDRSLALVFAQFIHSEEPQYNTTDVNTSHLIDAIHGTKVKLDLSVVGYFRSHVREDLQLSERDQELIYEHLAEPSSAFLIIRPFEIGICIAGFFFWTEGRLQTDTSDLEVPLIVSSGSGEEQEDPDGEKSTPIPNVVPSTTGIALSTIEHTHKSDGGSSTPFTEHLPPQNPSLRASARSSRRFPPVLSRLAMVSSVAAALTVSCYWGIPQVESAFEALRSKPSNRFGLAAVRATDGHLNVRWNLSAQQVRSMQKATLTVIDDKAVRELLLDTSQLRVGSLTYFPIGSDVLFRLELFLEDGRSESESVSSIAPVSAAAKTTSKGKAGSPLARQNASDVPNQSRAGSFSIPPQSVGQSESPAIPPKLKPRPGTQNSSSAVVPAADLSKSTGASAPPLSKAVVRRAMPARSQVQAPVQTSYAPPLPIKQMRPNLTLLKPGVLDHTVRITVQIRIDADGQVIDARSAEEDRNEPAQLSKVAIAAAREWRFNPATSQGKPIAVDHKIVFVFRPSEN